MAPVFFGSLAVIRALVLNRSVVLELQDSGINICSWFERRGKLYIELQVLYIYSFMKSLDQNPRTYCGHEECCPICICDLEAQADQKPQACV